MREMVRSLFILGFVVVFSSLNAQTYNLVWEDNFDGTTLDSSIWNVEQKIGVWNTGSNGEFQHYKKENVRVGDDGDGNNCLILTAKEESYNGYSYTSGKVTTKGKLAFRRGKLEASIKIPDLANGLWPALWTLGYVPLGWPDCGEIDILEMGHSQGISDGTQNSFMGAHLFWGPFNGGFPNYGTEFTASEDLSTGYFKHTLVWTETAISVYFNDAATPYFTMSITGNDFEEFRDYQHYIILNLAVGGSLPGITNKADITAPIPANMYVDWVKIYQEDGSKDINDSTLAPFGVFGVVEEEASTDMSMDLGFDLSNITTGLSNRTEDTPYEGDTALSYNMTNGQDYEIRLESGLLRNMSNYDEGSVQLYLKTDLVEDILIGVADTAGNEMFTTFSTASERVITRDGTWQLVYIVLSDFTGNVDISALKDMLIIKGATTTDGYLSVDQVLYQETVPAAGYYGIYTDNPNITENFVVDGVTKHLYIWENSVTFNEAFDPYEGENVLSYKSSGAQSWFGYGFISDNPLNLQAYENGYLNLSMRTASTGSFYIGLDTDGTNAEINFDAGSDPYGFLRDNEWHHLNIPVSDLTAKGLDLTAIKHIFKTGGGGSLGNIAIDDVYLSEGVSDIENPAINVPANAISKNDFKNVQSFYNRSLNELEIKGISGSAEVSVFTISGNLVFHSKTSQSNFNVDMANEPAGMYVVQVISSEQQVVNKFIKY